MGSGGSLSVAFETIGTILLALVLVTESGSGGKQQGAENMSKVSAFHTNSLGYGEDRRNVYHDQSECGYGKEIKLEHRESGTANRPRCDRCNDLAE